MASPQDLPRLAAHTKQRRLGLHLARLAAAKAADVSKDTWQRVEEGKPVREMNYAKIEPVLGWAPGSCLAILAGGEPEMLDPIPAGPEVSAGPEADPRSGVDDVIQRMLREGTPDGKILATSYEYDPATGGRQYRFAVAPADATPEDEQRIKEAFRAGHPAPPRQENGD